MHQVVAVGWKLYWLFFEAVIKQALRPKNGEFSITVWWPSKFQYPMTSDYYWAVSVIGIGTQWIGTCPHARHRPRQQSQCVLQRSFGGSKPTASPKCSAWLSGGVIRPDPLTLLHITLPLLTKTLHEALGLSESFELL